MGLLKLILQVFTFQRTMIVEGSHSNRIRTVNAIVPGSAFSCAILHIVLLWPCDKLLRLLPTIRLAKYVDDLSITVKGPRDKAADTVVAATKRLLDMLESDLDMEVSKTDASKQGKSVVLCTHQGMKQRMQRVMKQIGIRFAARESYLGVDCYGRGRRSGTSTKTRKMSAMRTRTKRLQMLKRHGAKVHKVALAGIKPSVLYGCKAMGLSESHIRALRSSISSCLPGQYIGRSTTLRLALHKADVQQECDSAPLTAWAATIWDGAMSDKELADAWYWQSQKVGMHQVKDKPSKWSRVTGPAGACILTARRIGWTWPTFDVFVHRSGRRINLRNFALKMYAQWRCWTATQRCGTSGQNNRNGLAWHLGHALSPWLVCASRLKSSRLRRRLWNT